MAPELIGQRGDEPRPVPIEGGAPKISLEFVAGTH
jgi:hypothetical protein